MGEILAPGTLRCGSNVVQTGFGVFYNQISSVDEFRLNLRRRPEVVEIQQHGR